MNPAGGPAVLTVVRTGPLVTVQDEGRAGHAWLGVTRSGACDRGAARLANRLVGNRAGAACLEVTLGGLELLAATSVTVAVTGARPPGVPWNAPVLLRAGSRLRLGTPATGLRSYVAVRGGFDVDPVLGSRSTDVMSGLGPSPLRAGDRLRVGHEAGPAPLVDEAAVPEPIGGLLTVRVLPGPRLPAFTEQAWRELVTATWTAGTEADRVGVRLDGPALARRGTTELPSEGMLRGAVQVPPSGRPVLFLADHPVTGGYPVIGYVADPERDSDVDRLAQLRPGQQLRFRPA